MGVNYTAFGLKIAGISSRKLSDPNEGGIKNDNLYNDKELWDDADLNWYDYGFRNYDPQIGRFPQLDPLTDEYPELTPYQYASDEPIANIDIDGLEAGNATKVFNQLQTLQEVVVVGGGKAVAKGASMAGNFIKGLGKSAWGTVTGLWDAVTSPIQTLKGIGNLMMQSPQVTQQQMYNAASEKYNAFKSGDANTKANIAGNVLGDFAQLLIGAGGVKTTTKVIQISKIAEGAEVISKVSKGEKGFNSFNKFKNVNGKAGDGQAWHHIVEQNPSNIQKFGAENIHKASNLVKVESGKGSLHARVSGFYSSKQPFTGGLTVRQWLGTKNFQEQFEFGMKMLKKFGF